MNEAVKKFLLAGDKFMPEMHLNNLDLLIVLVVHLLKTKNELKNLCKQEIKIIFTRMILSSKRTESEKVLRDKAFKIASNPKYDGYQRG